MLTRTILNNLITNEEYARKVLPHLKSEYFSDQTDRLVYECIRDYMQSYGALPSKESLLIDVDEKDNVPEEIFKNVVSLIQTFEQGKENVEWLVDKTEEFATDQAIYNAIMGSISIIEGKDQDKSRHVIPDMLKDALSVGFRNEVGHDYFEDVEQRYEQYHDDSPRLPFSVDVLNKITNGGLKEKSINLVLAGTNAGKTLINCSLAADWIRMGCDVLYITAEESEEGIAQRIDANLLDVDINNIPSLERDHFLNGVDRIKSKTHGRLIIKEYPGSTAHAGHVEILLNELWIKKNFRPRVIILDYINIFTSKRVKMSGSINTNTYVKFITEEMRAVSQKMRIPIVSSTQTNRGGQSSTDIDFEDVGESHGLSQTVDLLLGAMVPDELATRGLMLFKQIKSRYMDKTKMRKFVMGVDTSRMRIFDVDDDVQSENIKSIAAGSKPSIMPGEKKMKKAQDEEPTIRKPRERKGFDKINV